MDKYIGFDIDSKKTVACVVQKEKKDIYATIGSDVESMKKFLLSQRETGTKIHLTYEISGQAEFLYDNLVGCADYITVSNPPKMTWIYRTSQKNDRIDARKQAVLLSIDEIPKVHIPPTEIRQWRRAIIHRRNLIRKSTSTKNAIRSLLKSNGMSKLKYGRKWWSKINRQWMMELAAQATVNKIWGIRLSSLLEQLSMFELQLKNLTLYLDKKINNHPGGFLLMSVPGIGPRTAEAILAYTDDIKRFRSSKAYCSYFGLTPKLDESGSSRRLGHITKQDPSVVRWLLCESCWRTIRKSKVIRDFYHRVMAGQKERRKKALVAVSRKLLYIIRSMLLTGELYNESHRTEQPWSLLFGEVYIFLLSNNNRTCPSESQHSGILRPSGYPEKGIRISLTPN